MVQIGSVAGALLTFLIADRVDRLWPTRHLCALWILGIVIFLANGGRLGQVYAGRFIAGIGIGETSKSFAQHVCLYVVFSFLHVRTSRLTRPPFSFAQLSSHLFTSQKSHPNRFAACAPAFLWLGLHRNHAGLFILLGLFSSHRQNLNELMGHPHDHAYHVRRDHSSSIPFQL